MDVATCKKCIKFLVGMSLIIHKSACDTPEVDVEIAVGSLEKQDSYIYYALLAAGCNLYGETGRTWH